MLAARLKKWRRVLQELRAEVVKQGAVRIEPNRRDAATVGVADEDEQALSEMLQTLSSQRNKKQAELMSQIDAALRKLDERPDDFGSCEECEEEIPDKRLTLMPHARLCAECQAKRDPRRGEARRKITDYH